MSNLSANTISIARIRAIADEIISDTEWVNDSHSSAEHNGIVSGLEMLINHLNK